MKASYDIETWKDSGGSYALIKFSSFQMLLDSNYPDSLNVYKYPEDQDEEEFLPKNLIQIVKINDMMKDEKDIYIEMIHELINNETNEELIQTLEKCLNQALKENTFENEDVKELSKNLNIVCSGLEHYGKLICRIDFDETEEFKTYKVYLDSDSGNLYRITMKKGSYVNCMKINLEILGQLILINKEYLSYLDLTYLKEVK